MSEARRDSTSSLQRKKPPWLKLDIPAVGSPVEAAVAAAEEPSFPQGGPGQQGLWVQPAPAPPRDPVAQPLRRQAFLRSVSMPAEPARVPSPHHELRRPGLHRQMSITQTIRRYLAAPAAPWAGGWDGQDRGRRGVSPSGWGWGPDRGPSCLGFRPCHLFPVLPCPPACHLPPFSAPLQHLPSPLCLPHPDALAPNSRQVRFGRVHTLPLLGPPAARRALTQRLSLSRSLLRYLGQGMSVLASAGVCMACDLSGAASMVGSLGARAGPVLLCMSKGCGQPAWV